MESPKRFLGFHDGWKLFGNLLFIALVVYLMPKRVFSSVDDLSGSFIDHSWRLALNMAVKENLVWGRDFVFTYGPLGYLNTGFPEHVAKWSIVLYHLFIIANGAWMVRHFLFRAEGKVGLAVAAVLLLFNGGFLFLKESVTLGLYFAFHTLLFLKERRMVSLAAMSLCSILAFYIKVNMGIVLNLLVVVVFLFNLWKKPIGRVPNVVFLVMHFMALYALSVPLRVHLPGYVGNSLSVIDSYNDAMYIPSQKLYLAYAISMLALFAFPYMRSLNKVLASPYEMLACFITSGLIYVLFKQGFVRADFGHKWTFILGMPFFALSAFRYASDSMPRSRLALPLVGICLLSLFANRGSWFKIIKGEKGFGIFSESNGVGKGVNSISKRSTLPASFVKQMEGRSVDVLGFGISYIYYNGLLYNPRPVIQSYQAYNPRLIDLNVAKYTSQSAPDYVLYHFRSIDNRQPFWDEPKIYFPLLANYSIVDSVGVPAPDTTLLLFKRNERPRIMTSRIVLDTLVKLNERIPIPKSDRLLFMRVDCSRTLAGSLRRFLYQPSELGLELSYTDGVRETYRAIAPILKSGVPINRKVSSREEAFRFFQTDGSGGVAVDSLEFKGNPLYMQKDIRLEFVEYVFGG
jgi:hypothetical protein